MNKYVSKEINQGDGTWKYVLFLELMLSDGLFLWECPITLKVIIGILVLSMTQ